jgi:hypothetical protein
MKPLTKYLIAVAAAAAMAAATMWTDWNIAGAQPVPITTMTFCDAKTTVRVTKLHMRPYDVALQADTTTILGMSAHSYFGANKPTPPDFLFAILPRSKEYSNFLVYKDRLVIEDTQDTLPFCGIDTAVPTPYRKIS